MSSPSQQQEAIDNNSALPSQTPIIQAAHEMASQRFSPTQRGSTPLQPILSPKEIALSPRMANMASQTATQQGRTTPPQTDEHDLLGGENNGVNGLHIDENTDNEHHDQTFDEDETSHELAQFDWTKLEDEFEAAMHDADMKEEEVAKQFKALIDVSLHYLW